MRFVDDKLDAQETSLVILVIGIKQFCSVAACNTIETIRMDVLVTQAARRVVAG